MKVGPKFKLAKRLGASIFEKTQTQKFALSAERAAMNKKGSRGRGPTEYGKQLLEKQKVRVTYGISESQFSTYVANAMATHGAIPADILHRQLELRLDNILYRMGLASTRRAARQMASHGHITVNGKKTTVPSQAIKIGDRIAVREGSKSRVLFENFAEKFMERPLPSWLTWDPKKMEGGVQELPTSESANTAGDLPAVLSFYSR
ncbi:MAG: rpsD [Parcubacteria group bacterium]|nr:rpsD [Parcubacteria group bacterium]